MALVQTEDLLAAIRAAEGPCAALYIPMHTSGSEAMQAALQLKNLLKTAENELQQLGHDAATIDRVLSGPRELLREANDWPAKGAGLAILASAGGTTMFRTPIDLPEIAVVADRLHVKPLLPLLTGNGRFFVLSLSQKATALFEGSAEGLRPVESADLPHRVKDVVGYDVEQKSLQFRSSSAGTQFHGHGAGSDDQKKDEALKFLRVVDDGVRAILGDSPPPLVLAAAEPIASMYRGLSKVSSLLAEGLQGNFEHADTRTLFDKSLPIVTPHFEASRRDAAAKIAEGLGTGKVVQRLEEVLPAAREGRIEVLFAATDVPRWGRVGEAFERHDDQRQAGDVDLVDVAAVECLEHGGTVHGLPANSIPGDANVLAAVLRY